MAILYKSEPVRGAQWAKLFAAHAPDLPFHIWPEVGSPESIRYLIAWKPDDVLDTLPNLQVVFSVGAGVDQLNLSRIPAHIPVVRLIEPGLIDGMVEYVTEAVLAIHRDLFLYAAQQSDGIWKSVPIRPARSRRVGVLGLGVLGRAVLERLGTFGFSCRGWNRSPRDLPGVACFAGGAELASFLAGTDILICLLPMTDETRGILNKHLFDQLPNGASLIHVGRGPQLVSEDLIEALECGPIQMAVIDVLDPEPPPRDHPFWLHPRVRLTPHIASAPQAESAVDAILVNIRRHMAGELMHGAIDRSRGY